MEDEAGPGDVDDAGVNDEEVTMHREDVPRSRSRKQASATPRTFWSEGFLLSVFKSSKKSSPPQIAKNASLLTRIRRVTGFRAFSALITASFFPFAGRMT